MLINIPVDSAIVAIIWLILALVFVGASYISPHNMVIKELNSYKPDLTKGHGNVSRACTKCHRTVPDDAISSRPPNWRARDYRRLSHTMAPT